MRRLALLPLAALALVGGSSAGTSADSVPHPLTSQPALAIGRGGAAASVDPLATRAAIAELRKGGNAIDAAVAAAAVLGVVEPYSCGIGGGGFMLIYLAKRHRVLAVDSRETAPKAFTPKTFIDPKTGQPIPFPEQVTSGLGVGVPGTLMAWQQVDRRYGRVKRLGKLLAPAIAIARKGFVIDQTFHDFTDQNKDRFNDFASTRAIYLTSDGQAKPVGTVQRNRDLAKTYALIARRGINVLYRGAVARAIVRTVHQPPLVAGAKRNVRPGLMELADLARYRINYRVPVQSTYRGLHVFGMSPPSSGGSTVAEALNILEGYDLGHLNRVHALHDYLEATRLSYADRNAYLGDPSFTKVPLRGLVSKAYAATRRSKIGLTAAKSPVPPGDPLPYDSGTRFSIEHEGQSTTHLTVTDHFGNIVSYTFTIEQTGGSGIVVPGYGFLLNNELTDFESQPGLANSPAAGKRPRSSMSPTLVFRGRRPLLALGSPGGSTIITTVLQILVNRLDFGLSLPDAIAAPRASQRNSASTQAEPGFLASPEAVALRVLGHSFSSTPEIGAATGIEFLAGGRLEAVAEPTRRGGGSALVLRP